MPTRSVVFALAGCTLAFAASAATPFDAKPGLWEVRHTSVIHSAGSTPDLSSLSPAQRARIQQGMARFATGQPTTRVFQECITKEDLEKDPFAQDQKQGGCTDQLLDRSSRHIKGKMVCENGHGTFEFTAKSPEHVVGTVSMQGQKGGFSGTMNADMDGRWLGSSCGDVKPGQVKVIRKE